MRSRHGTMLYWGSDRRGRKISPPTTYPSAICAGVEMIGRRASPREDLFAPDKTAAVEGTNSGCHAAIPPPGSVRSSALLPSVQPRRADVTALLSQQGRGKPMRIAIA
jgi:hypothetical protein